MNIAFGAPLSRAWARTVRMLFRPFRLETWLVLGFAAFLSEYLSGKGGGGRFSYGGHDGGSLHAFLEHVFHPVWGPLMGAIVVAVVVAAVVITWVSCRGRFIFLDNVMRERTGIVEPWSRFKRLGNSLFAWTLAFAIIVLGIVAAVVVPSLATIVTVWDREGLHLAALGALVGLLATLAPIVIIAACILLCLSHFVVPIMYKHDLVTTAAWGRFLPLLRSHPLHFVGYALMMFVLWVAVGLVVVVVGFSTCCVGFVLVGFPYVGSVVLLPVHVTFRGFGPEFLSQFGPEYAIVPATPAATPPPA